MVQKANNADRIYSIICFLSLIAIYHRDLTKINQKCPL